METDHTAPNAHKRPGEGPAVHLAQINRAYDSCLDDVREKVRYDLQYLRTQSMAEDVKIMLKTMPTVLLKIRGW